MSRLKRTNTLIGARLYHDDPEESRALDVLQHWQERTGWTKTQIITRALLALDELPDKDQLADKLLVSIQEVREVLAQLRRNPTPSSADDPGEGEIGSALLASLKARASAGKRLTNEESHNGQQ